MGARLYHTFRVSIQTEFTKCGQLKQAQKKKTYQHFDAFIDPNLWPNWRPPKPLSFCPSSHRRRRWPERSGFHSKMHFCPRSLERFYLLLQCVKYKQLFWRLFWFIFCLTGTICALQKFQLVKQKKVLYSRFNVQKKIYFLLGRGEKLCGRRARSHAAIEREPCGDWAAAQRTWS